MNNQRNVTIIADMDGRSIVVINDIRFRGKSWNEWDEIEEYLRQYVGECYEILETSEKIFVGDDFPDEYVGSNYTAKLWPDKNFVKANASQGIPELIEISTKEDSTNNTKSKHSDDAEFGWSVYRTRFALPKYVQMEGVYKLTGYKIYRADLIVREDHMNEKYLYDLINIKRL